MIFKNITKNLLIFILIICSCEVFSQTNPPVTVNCIGGLVSSGPDTLPFQIDNSTFSFCRSLKAANAIAKTISGNTISNATNKMLASSSEPVYGDIGSCVKAINRNTDPNAESNTSQIQLNLNLSMALESSSTFDMIENKYLNFNSAIREKIDGLCKIPKSRWNNPDDTGIYRLITDIMKFKSLYNKNHCGEIDVSSLIASGNNFIVGGDSNGYLNYSSTGTNNQQINANNVISFVNLGRIVDELLIKLTDSTASGRRTYNLNEMTFDRNGDNGNSFLDKYCTISSNVNTGQKVNSSITTLLENQDFARRNGVDGGSANLYNSPDCDNYNKFLSKFKNNRDLYCSVFKKLETEVVADGVSWDNSVCRDQNTQQGKNCASSFYFMRVNQQFVSRTDLSSDSSTDVNYNVISRLVPELQNYNDFNDPNQLDYYCVREHAKCWVYGFEGYQAPSTTTVSTTTGNDFFSLLCENKTLLANNTSSILGNNSGVVAGNNVVGNGQNNSGLVSITTNTDGTRTLVFQTPNTTQPGINNNYPSQNNLIANHTSGNSTTGYVLNQNPTENACPEINLETDLTIERKRICESMKNFRYSYNSKFISPKVPLRNGEYVSEYNLLYNSVYEIVENKCKSVSSGVAGFYGLFDNKKAYDLLKKCTSSSAYNKDGQYEQLVAFLGGDTLPVDKAAANSLLKKQILADYLYKLNVSDGNISQLCSKKLEELAALAPDISIESKSLRNCKAYKEVMSSADFCKKSSDFLEANKAFSLNSIDSNIQNYKTKMVGDFINNTYSLKFPIDSSTKNPKEIEKVQLSSANDYELFELWLRKGSAVKYSYNSNDRRDINVGDTLMLNMLMHQRLSSPDGIKFIASRCAGDGKSMWNEPGTNGLYDPGTQQILASNQPTGALGSSQNTGVNPNGNNTAGSSTLDEPESFFYKSDYKNGKNDSVSYYDKNAGQYLNNGNQYNYQKQPETLNPCVYYATNPYLCPTIFSSYANVLVNGSTTVTEDFVKNVRTTITNWTFDGQSGGTAKYVNPFYQEKET